MIPLRDANPSRTIPFVNYCFIALNVLAFLFELSLGRQNDELLYRFGVVPARWIEDVESMQIGISSFVPFISSMFLHGGWMHLLGNMLFLYVFGDNIEDRFGHLKYILFYVASGVAAALTQVYINPASDIPMVGASGAIAGVLGSYVFMYPKAKITTLIPIVVFFQIVELPAYLFLGLWFLMQIFSAMMSLGIGGDAGGVAWWAHIGGFVAGGIMIPFLIKRR